MAVRFSPLMWLFPALVVALAPTAAPACADVTGNQVKLAIRRGVAALRARQQADGKWAERYEHFAGGETTLATLALLQAGERADSPAVAAALPHVRALPDKQVYVVALKIMVLAQADAQAYAAEINAAARWLAEAQGTHGLWSYTPGEARFDHSNTQFALLGLHAAAEAGVRIPQKVWRDALAGVIRTQKEDGGWSYQNVSSQRPYGSMTAAAVADLLILGSQIQSGRERGFRDGAAPNCGRYATNRPLVGGLGWLGRRFEADRNPGRSGNTHYWLYAVERCGILSGQRYFGQHDWYRAGAEFLVRTQRADGTWDGQLVNTAFALLFLAKGHKPLLIQKLQWSNDNEWNPDRYDVENLVGFIGDRLGEPVAWQVVHFDAPLEDWLAAPLLYMQGHRFPRWNAAQSAKVRRFIEQGGTLLAEACCGRAEFISGFTRFAEETFGEFPLRELGEEHSVYHAHFDCQPHGLMGLDLGCRTSVIFSPRDMSCLWEQGDIPELSEAAFRLGTNVAAYALGRRPLQDRLDVVILPEARPAEASPPARDAVQFCQVVHASDWRPFPHALVGLAEFLQRELNLDVVTQYRTVQLDEPDLHTCPLLYLAGHFRFDLSPAERAALVGHLQRGGFVLVDNCCGPDPFDADFRRFVSEVFNGARFAPLPADHPIFRGEPGFNVQRVRYGPDVAKARPDLNTPELWGVEINGRLALVYSPFALGCGLEGQAFAGCWGLAAEDAQRLAANIILYALTH
jgi:hypothetical protein